jgi:hypothetical protein
MYATFAELFAYTDEERKARVTPIVRWHRTWLRVHRRVRLGVEN